MPPDELGRLFLSRIDPKASTALGSVLPLCRRDPHDGPLVGRCRLLLAVQGGDIHAEGELLVRAIQALPVLIRHGDPGAGVDPADVGIHHVVDVLPSPSSDR
jgi:hypothetical protein